MHFNHKWIEQTTKLITKHLGCFLQLSIYHNFKNRPAKTKHLHVSNRLVYSVVSFPLLHKLQLLFHVELCWLKFPKNYRFYTYFLSYLVESLPILTVQGVNDNVFHFREIKASILHKTMKFLNRKRKRKNLISGEVWKYTLKNIQERNKSIWHPLEIFSISLKLMRKADVTNEKCKTEMPPQLFTNTKENGSEGPG